MKALISRVCFQRVIRQNTSFQSNDLYLRSCAWSSKLLAGRGRCPFSRFVAWRIIYLTHQSYLWSKVSKIGQPECYESTNACYVHPAEFNVLGYSNVEKDSEPLFSYSRERQGWLIVNLLLFRLVARKRHRESYSLIYLLDLLCGQKLLSAFAKVLAEFFASAVEN